MSAKYGHGVEDIKDWILSKLPVGPAYYPKVLRTLSIDVLYLYIFIRVISSDKLEG